MRSSISSGGLREDIDEAVVEGVDEAVVEAGVGADVGVGGAGVGPRVGAESDDLQPTTANAMASTQPCGGT
jgi:hypothetical protein